MALRRAARQPPCPPALPERSLCRYLACSPPPPTPAFKAYISSGAPADKQAKTSTLPKSSAKLRFYPISCSRKRAERRVVRSPRGTRTAQPRAERPHTPPTTTTAAAATGPAPATPFPGARRRPAALTGVGRVLSDEPPGQEPHRQRCRREADARFSGVPPPASPKPEVKSGRRLSRPPPLPALPDLPAPLPPSTATFTSVIPPPGRAPPPAFLYSRRGPARPLRRHRPAARLLPAPGCSPRPTGEAGRYSSPRAGVGSFIFSDRRPPPPPPPPSLCFVPHRADFPRAAFPPPAPRPGPGSRLPPPPLAPSPRPRSARSG